MKFWEIFWMISIGFALVSFAILSVKVLINGFQEVKDMLTTLDERSNDSE